MILGRWQSAAFMNYIRPQVMEWTAGMSIAMLNTPDFTHADPTGTPGSNNSLQLSDLETIQNNLDHAVESPEEIKFNGSVATASFDRQLNLEF